MTAEASEHPAPSATSPDAAGSVGVVLRVLSIPHLLCLDAPVVAVVWARLFAETLGLARLLPGVYAMLFCSVWCIYLGDRLLDTACWQKSISNTDRHRFFQKHWWKMAALGLAPAGYAVWLVAGDALGGACAIPSGIVGGGLLLSTFVVLYFLVRLAANRYVNALAIAWIGVIALILLLMARMPMVLIGVFLMILLMCLGISLFSKVPATHACPRELLCGLLFALGSAMPVYWHISDSSFPFDSDIFAIPVEMLLDGSTFVNVDTLLFAGLCTLNCIGISIWEKAADRGGRDPGAIAQYAPQIEQRFPILTVSLAVIAAAFLWDTPSGVTSSWQLRLAVILSSASLLAIHHFRNHLSPLASRLLADIALLWPLPLLALT